MLKFKSIVAALMLTTTASVGATNGNEFLANCKQEGDIPDVVEGYCLGMTIGIIDGLLVGHALGVTSGIMYLTGDDREKALKPMQKAFDEKRQLVICPPDGYTNQQGHPWPSRTKRWPHRCSPPS